jgi:hypothetical protein
MFNATVDFVQLRFDCCSNQQRDGWFRRSSRTPSNDSVRLIDANFAFAKTDDVS